MINIYLKKIKISLRNCLWLIIPILIWNFLFTSKLTQVGYAELKNVPKIILYLESILRIIIFVLPLWLTIKNQSVSNKIGWILYILGVKLYFISWCMVILLPEHLWSKLPIGLLAPAYLPIIWLLGISLISNSILYLIISIVFTILHTAHFIFSFQF